MTEKKYKYLLEFLSSFDSEKKISDAIKTFVENNTKAKNKNAHIEIIDLVGNIISVRLYNSLRSRKINTIGDMHSLYISGQIYKHANFGKKTFYECSNLLESYGYDISEFKSKYYSFIN